MSFTVEKQDSWNPTPNRETSLLESLTEQQNREALEKAQLRPESLDEPKDLTDLTGEANKDQSVLEKTQTPPVDPKAPPAEEIEDALPETFGEILEKLSKDNVLSLYEDHEIKTYEDLKNLIADNQRQISEESQQMVFQQQLEALPPQFQSIMKYGLAGGQDVQSLLQAWSQVEETYTADITSEQGQEKVVRDYLTLTQYGTPEMIEQDIKTWKDLGTLSKKAETYKPALEEHYMNQVAAQEQQAYLEQQQRDMYFQQYTESVGQVLSQPDLNGIPLDEATKNFLYQNSYPQYQSQVTGEPIDALQAAVEELKFGQNANPALYAELMLFATNPEYYKQTLASQLKSQLAQEKERKLRQKVSEDVSGTNLETPRNTPRPRSQSNERWF